MKIITSTDKGVGKGDSGVKPPPIGLAALVLYSRYWLICRKKTIILVLASSAIVVSNITAQAHCPNIAQLRSIIAASQYCYRSYTIAIMKSVGPWPVFMAVGKVRTTATVVVDKINN